MIAPPGMPKATSQPTASNDRTSDWAAVSRTGAPAGGAGFGLGADGAGGIPGVGLCRGVALVIGFASRSDREIWATKNPRRPDWSFEGARRQSVSQASTRLRSTRMLL